MTLALADRLNLASNQVLARLKTPHDRMLSWDHCYNFFHRLPQTPSATKIDEAAVQLGFYLASYGMYRGSTVLLREDYKFLIPVVQKPKTKVTRVEHRSPDHLRGPGLHTSGGGGRMGETLRFEGFLRQNGIGQTSIGILSTKIMLGTWATVPAFDTSFKAALRATDIGRVTYSRKNFFTVFAYLRQSAPTFQQQVDRFHAEGFAHCPAMRVVDALLWQLGGGDNTSITS